MILTIGYRGTFRQAQYETVTIEGSLSLDSDKDPEWFGLGDGLHSAMRTELHRLTGPAISSAAQFSRYTAEETVVHEWEGLTEDAASNPPPPRNPHRRVRRGS